MTALSVDQHQLLFFDPISHVVSCAIHLLIQLLGLIFCAKTDIFGRWGGEEFLVIVPEFATNARLIAEKLRIAMEKVQHPQVGTVTASMGVALYAERDTASSLVSRADSALYRAKEKGRNCVEEAE